jgi:hypothetical protein
MTLLFLFATAVCSNSTAFSWQVYLALICYCTLTFHGTNSRITTLALFAFESSGRKNESLTEKFVVCTMMAYVLTKAVFKFPSCCYRTTKYIFRIDNCQFSFNKTPFFFLNCPLTYDLVCASARWLWVLILHFQPLYLRQSPRNWRVCNRRYTISRFLPENAWKTKQATKEPMNQAHSYTDTEPVTFLFPVLAADINTEHSNLRTQTSLFHPWLLVQGGSNMTGTNCDLFTHK